MSNHQEKGSLEQVNTPNKIEQEVLSSLPEINDAAEMVKKALHAGQEHLFENWKDRSDRFRENLLRDLLRIDWEVLAQALKILAEPKKAAELEEHELSPMLMRTSQEQAELREQEEELGRQGLIQGKVAWLIPAGGSGSRLVRVLPKIYASLPFKRTYKVADEQMRRFDEKCAKGQLPITPVLGKSFYESFIEQALALGARVNRMPVLLFMLSDETHQASIYAITHHPLYSKLERAILMFDHGMNPVLDHQGRCIPRDDHGHLVFSGNGNGGMFKALRSSSSRGGPSIFQYLEDQGIEMVGFSNVDNLVSGVVLPHMLGSHLRLGVSLTFGVCKKVDAFERVGMIVRLKSTGKLDKIEYNVFPESLAAAVNPGDPSRLLYEHGDVNVFIMDLDEMEKVRNLPLQMYRNKMAKTSRGSVSGNKFESFAFHIIRQVDPDRVDVKEILRGEQFMPTKNSIGRDSPATVIRALCTRNMRWLEAQGAKMACQTVTDALEDYRSLVRKHLEPAAGETSLEPEVRELKSMLEGIGSSETQETVDRLFHAVCALGSRASKAGLEKLQLAAEHVHSILQPGEARAFVEFSPAFALEGADLAETGAGEDWVLEKDCQVAFTGHPARVTVGAGFTVRQGGAFILDIENEYGDIMLSDDRWLTFELEKAGSAEIGENVTVEQGAVVEIHVRGDGRVVIPDGAVLKGEHRIEVPPGKTVTLGG